MSSYIVFLAKLWGLPSVARARIKNYCTNEIAIQNKITSLELNQSHDKMFLTAIKKQDCGVVEGQIQYGSYVMREKWREERRQGRKETWGWRAKDMAGWWMNVVGTVLSVWGATLASCIIVTFHVTLCRSVPSLLHLWVYLPTLVSVLHSKDVYCVLMSSVLQHCCFSKINCLFFQSSPEEIFIEF